MNRPQSKNQTTPEALAALLMDAACKTSAQERQALEQLGGLLAIDPGLVQAELMFLRTFAVDMAVATALGPDPERTALMELFYQYWERIAQEVEFGLVEDLEAHLQYYTEALEQSLGAGRGLGDEVGQAFAARFATAGDGAAELALLGGRMFGTLYEEVADLLEQVEIVLDEEG